MVNFKKIIAFLLKNPYIFGFLFFVLFLIGGAIYVFIFPFEKVIMLKNKSDYASGKKMYNTVSDNNDNVYIVTNAWPLLHFTSAEVLNKLIVGKSYRIRGYGVRVPIFGIYPNIVSAVEL